MIEPAKEPYLGMTVHVVTIFGEECAAIVTRVLEDGEVDLMVFKNNVGSSQLPGVRYSGSRIRRTWHEVETVHQ